MRTDIHKPSTIQPLEYNFVALGYQRCDGIEDCYEIQHNRRLLEEHRKATGATFASHDHGGNCQCCGAHCLYTAIFHHVESNKYIRTGLTCAEKLDMGDFELFRAFRKGVNAANVCKAGKNKAKAILAQEDLNEAWTWYVATLDDLERAGVVSPGKSTTDMVTVRDIVSKIVKYGNPSDKQLNFVRMLIKNIHGHKERQAKWDAEKAKAADLPEGRQVVNGTVLKEEWRDAIDFQCAARHVMTVKSVHGWMVWGTVPASIDSVKRGDIIEFTATLQVSDKDPKFGFHKRPSKATIIEKKEVVEV